MSKFMADAHFDLGEVLFDYYKLGEKDVIKTHLLTQWQSNNVRFIIAAIFVDDHYLPEGGLRNALNQITLIKEEIHTLDEVMLINNNDDFNKMMVENKIGIMLSLEGLEPIGRDLSLIDTFYDLGVRAAGLTWSRQNFVADGSRFGDENTSNGLSNFGKKVIKKMRSKNMIVDVSHLNDAGLVDLDGPIYASHSNARAVNPITRNLTDEQIVKIAQSGGVIGINNIKPIVGGHNFIVNMCNHIDHIKRLVGTDHICFGFDRCNIFGQIGLRYGNSEDEAIDSLEDYSHVNLILEELAKRGYDQAVLEDIMYKNIISFCRRNLK